VEQPEEFLLPVDIEELVFDASAGSDYTLVILSNRSAFVAGNISLNAYEGHFGVARGDLKNGVNTLIPITNVAIIDGDVSDILPAPQFRSVIAGVESSDGSGRIHSVFIDMEGNAYASGNNDVGQLCLGDEVSRDLPTRIKLPGNETAKSAAVGGGFTLILSDSGRVFGCGSNAFGQLGLGDVLSTNLPDDGNGLSEAEFISAGYDFSLVLTRGLTENDLLYVMGSNDFGQLCFSTGGNPQLTPIRNAGLDGISSIAAGFQSSYISTVDGNAYACGLNDVGQLGDGSLNDSDGTNVTIAENIIAVFSGPSSKSAFFHEGDGKIYGTGLNSRGQLGVGDSNSTDVPVEVEFSEGETFGNRGLSTSTSHTLAW